MADHGPMLAHDLVYRHARGRPDAVALSDGATAITYAQLAERASRVAGGLAELGVRPETTVAVLAERSIELIIGLLGTLAAGAAYVPVDPAFPDERVAALLSDTMPRALLSQSKYARRAASLAQRTATIETAAVNGPVGHDPRPHPDALAYIIHTSGSSGRPKGVMVSHRNLVGSALAREAVYADPPERMPLLSSTVFDSSLGVTFWTLAAGGELLVGPPDLEADVRKLTSVIERRAVTHLALLPALYSLILAEADPARLASLRTVVVAGEAWPPVLSRRHRELLSHVAFYSEWGPTECSIWSSSWKATSAGIEHPLGEPISGTTITVRDDNLDPVPPGVAGEACVQGPGVSRGYLDRPGLTAGRFVPDPMAGEDGARLYRTGDLVRRTLTGELQFLGRLDNQVKVRGFRIEPEEVEAALAALPGVRQAAVRAVGQDEARYLAAYLVADSAGPRPSDASLRRSLARRLPEYMIPSVWRWLEHMPVTASGKLDRARLPDDPPPAADRPAEPAASDLERRVAQVWADLLGVSDVGRADSFFSIGGNSLLAMQVTARLDRMFGIDLQVRALFENPTVAGLADAVTGLLVERVGQLSDAEASRLLRELERSSGDG